MNSTLHHQTPAKMYKSLHKQLTTSFSQTSSNVITHECTSIASLINYMTTSRKFLQSIFLSRNLISSLSSPSNPNAFSVFPSLLQSCASISLTYPAKCLHGYFTKSGFLSWVDVNSALINVYLKLGENVSARQLFDEMPVRNSDYFDNVISGFGSAGLFDDVLAIFEEMVLLGLTPCFESVRKAIVACGKLRTLKKGKRIHSYVGHFGFDKCVVICNMLISMYIKLGGLDVARCTFDAMEKKDLVTWNSLITRYAQTGDWAEALNIYLAMKEDGCYAYNNVTLLGLVVACGQCGNLDLGRSIHGRCIRAGLFSDFRLGTAILDMYAKCGDIECAEMLFEDEVFEKTLVSWNSLISGYSKSRYYYKAVNCFKRMCVTSNMNPDAVTLANVIPAYSSLRTADSMRSIHALIIKKGIDMTADVVLGTAMIDAYGKCSNITGAEILFRDIKVANTPSWNAMLTAYYQNNCSDKGLQRFVEMLRGQILPDSVTIVLLLQMSGQLGTLKIAKMAHGYGFIKGFSTHFKVENSLLDMYMKCKSAEKSELLFRLMDEKNIITWNTMLSGYVKIGSHSNALKLFSEMVLENLHRPDPVSLISLIHASSVLNHGADISHAFAIKLGFSPETVVMNSLMDAYAKNGFVDKASSLFMQMGQTRDQWSWNVMIAGYGMNGQGEKSCELLNEMGQDGYEPDSITFTSLLSACAHSGMVHKGCQYFNLMVHKYKIRPNLEHWTCIINMFGRAGILEEAYKLVTSNLSKAIRSDSHAVWGALMDACRMYKNLELGEIAGRQLLKLSPQNSSYCILVSNLYASTKRWDEAMEAREVFSDGSVVKEPALSTVNT